MTNNVLFGITSENSAIFFPGCIFYIEGVYLAHALTVEEGAKAILECPGFVPNPSDPGEDEAVFNWYKAKASDVLRDGTIINLDGRMAFYDKSDGAQFTYGDLKGRATIDGVSGALEIPQTRVSDDHFYTCYFYGTASGSILGEAQLVISGEYFWFVFKIIIVS